MKSAKTGKYCCLDDNNRNKKQVQCDDSCGSNHKFHALSNADDIIINKGASNPQDRCAIWSSDHKGFLNIGLNGGNTLQKAGEDKRKANDNRLYFKASDAGNGKVRIMNMGGQKCLRLHSNRQIKGEECSGLTNCPNCVFELEAVDSYGGIL